MAPTLQSDTRQVKSRRVSKHLTERKRRARINESLLQLKTIVYPALKNEVVQNSKMEKADILDMTLRYVKVVQQQSREGKALSVDQYHAGYTECLSQITSFLGSCDTMSLETRRRLVTHLADKGMNASASEQRQTSHQQLPATSVGEAQLSPPNGRAPFTQQGVVYLLPAHTVQPIVQPQFSPTQTLVPSPVVSILPTPPSSPVSVKQYSPPSSHRIVYQTVLADAGQVSPSAVSMVTVGAPVSSAQDSDVWRPW